MNSLKPDFNIQIAIWLFFISFMIVSMILIGGATRLTGSGLSMVEWRPFFGFLPPLSDEEWNRVFDLYKLSPEFININSWMNLYDFKKIFLWEYVHRVWGRLIGLIFFIPFIYFLFTKNIDNSIFYRLMIMIVLGACQGLIGWWMVKSGLTGDPYVSQYRLSIHLSLAFLILVIIFWTALDLYNGYSDLPSGMNLLAIIFVSLTIVAGTFVSGLDAGLIYNEFPLMGKQLIPSEYGNMGFLDPFENPVGAQFNHRLLATISLFIVTLTSLFSIKKSGVKLKSILLILAIFCQFFIGIFTLIYMVPIQLGIIHQLGGVILFMTLIWFTHNPKPIGS